MNPGPVLVTQWQMEQQILQAQDTQPGEFFGIPCPDPFQFSDRLFGQTLC
jgi:hypothetical protein